MIARRALVVVALVAGVAAGVLYYVGAQRVSVIVAARNLDPTHPLANDDLAVAAFPPEAVPAGALLEIASAVGRIPRAPLWKGQVLLADALGAETATFRTGLALAPGMRAVALPVGAAQAVGGALVPGARVDVLAVPIAGRAPAGRATELLTSAALVLDVRTESGAAHGGIPGKSVLSAATERIGSVVIAIERADELRFADRIATSTFILSLASSHE